MRILHLEKGKTNNNSNYYSLQVLLTTTGEVIDAIYFGNTRPKKVIKIDKYTTKQGKTYNVATIQPHQSRNKLGRFISGRR